MVVYLLAKLVPLDWIIAVALVVIAAVAFGIDLPGLALDLLGIPEVGPLW